VGRSGRSRRTWTLATQPPTTLAAAHRRVAVGGAARAPTVAGRPTSRAAVPAPAVATPPSLEGVRAAPRGWSRGRWPALAAGARAAVAAGQALRRASPRPAAPLPAGGGAGCSRCLSRPCCRRPYPRPRRPAWPACPPCHPAAAAAAAVEPAAASLPGRLRPGRPLRAGPPCVRLPSAKPHTARRPSGKTGGHQRADAPTHPVPGRLPAFRP